MMQFLRFVLGAILMAAGLLTCIVGVIGVFKFRYAANRMHSAAINDTLGISLCMLGLAVLAPDIWSAVKLLLVIFFFWISAPVASHLLCRLEVETNEDRGSKMQVHLLDRPETDAGDVIFGTDEPLPAEDASLNDDPAEILPGEEPRMPAEDAEATGADAETLQAGVADAVDNWAEAQPEMDAEHAQTADAELPMDEQSGEEEQE